MDRETFEQALLSKSKVTPRKLEDLQSSGALAGVFPEVQKVVGFGGDGRHKDLWWHTKLVVSQCPSTPHIRWAALFHDVGKVDTFEFKTGKVTFHGHEALSAKLWNRAARRCGWFGDEERRAIRFLIYNLGHVESYEKDWTDSAVRRVYKLAGGHFQDLVTLARADITTKHQHKRRAHHERMVDLVKRAKALAEADAVVPALPKGLGDVLCAELGLEPSPELGALMKRLRAAVEAGELPRSGEHAVYLDWCRSHHG